MIHPSPDPLRSALEEIQRRDVLWVSSFEAEGKTVIRSDDINMKALILGPAAEVARAALSAQQEREAVIEECARVAESAELPGGFRWGRDAMEQFNFGKKRASEAIRALKSLPAGDGWSGMDTFPRDGESYLVCDRRILDGNHQVVFFDDMATKPDYCLATSDGPSFHFAAFTDWRPLPAPPAVGDG